MPIWHRFSIGAWWGLLLACVGTEAATDRGEWEVDTTVHSSDLIRGTAITYTEVVEAFGVERAIAELGPRLLEALDDLETDHRSTPMVIVALGMADYRPAVPKLIPFLDDQRNWRVAFSAARALTRLTAHEARPALIQANREHWYWGVRYAAREALLVLDGEQSELSNPFRFSWGKPATPGRHQFFNEIDGPIILGPPGPDLSDVELRQRQELFEECERKAGRLETLRNALYAQALGYAPAELEQITGEYPPRVLNLKSWLDPVSDKNVIKRLRLPDCGIRFGEGSLLGTDHGEWGGELIYYMPRTLPRTVASEGPYIGLHKVGDLVFAVPGWGMMDQDTWLVQIKGETPTTLQPHDWLLLPGGADYSGKMADGSMLIACSGGWVVVSTSGEISEWVPESDEDCMFRYETVAAEGQ